MRWACCRRGSPRRGRRPSGPAVDRHRVGARLGDRLGHRLGGRLGSGIGLGFGPGVGPASASGRRRRAGAPTVAIRTRPAGDEEAARRRVVVVDLDPHPGDAGEGALDPGGGAVAPRLDDARPATREAGARRAAEDHPGLVAGPADQHEAGQLAQAGGDQGVEHLVEAGTVVDQLPEAPRRAPSRSAAASPWRGRRRCRTTPRDGRTRCGRASLTAAPPASVRDSRAGARSRSGSRPPIPPHRRRPRSRCPCHRRATAAATIRSAASRGSAVSARIAADLSSSIIPLTPSEQSTSRSTEGSGSRK